MKKFYVLFSVFMVAIVGLATIALAQQDSVFDNAENWIIRAYVEGATVKIELRDTSNNLIPLANITGLTSNPQTVANNATNQDVSLSFDDISGTTYILYTDATGLQLRSYNISSGPRISVTPLAVNFGDKNTGSTYTQTVTVENQGSANLTLGTINVTNTSGTAFSRSGGTCANNGQVLAQDASCTVIVAFLPTADYNYAGTLTIPSNDDNVNVALSGHGVGVVDGQPDLVIVSLDAPSAISNNLPFYMNVCVKNQGTTPAGSFTVRGYLSPDRTFGNTGDIFLFDWEISLLGEGQTECNSIRVTVDGAPIHSYLYFLVKADVNDQVMESDENNNLRFTQTRIQR
ncbi:MAG: CARDB domain-containing protein [Nitrospirota bacterium]